MNKYIFPITWKTIAVGLVIFASVVYLTDAAIKYSGRLRSLSYATVHETVEEPYFHTKDGRRVEAISLKEPLYVNEHVRKYQSCHAAVSTRFMEVGTNTIYRGEGFVAWFVEGDFKFSENVVLPVNMPAGNYRYQKKTTVFCAGDQIYYITNIDLPISFN